MDLLEGCIVGPGWLVDSTDNGIWVLWWGGEGEGGGGCGLGG